MAKREIFFCLNATGFIHQFLYSPSVRVFELEKKYSNVIFLSVASFRTLYKENNVGSTKESIVYVVILASRVDHRQVPAPPVALVASSLPRVIPGQSAIARVIVGAISADRWNSKHTAVTTSTPL